MLLINSSPKNALKIFQPFLPIFVPVGLGYLVAAFRKEGIDIQFLDEQIEDDIFEQCVARAEASLISKPYVFGFSVLTAGFRNAIELSKRLKDHFQDDCIILMGGIHPTANPEEFLAYDHIDLVLRGEAEVSLIDLYKKIKSEENYLDVSGLSYRDENGFHHNPITCEMVDIDTLPPFPYELFARKDYDLGFILSSRGCPYNCIFCSNRVTTGKKYRYASAKTIVESLKTLYEKYNRTFIIFLDDNFLVSKKRIYELIDGIKAEGLHEKMSFSFQCRGDNVDYDLMCALYEASFTSVFFGLETASERIMKLVKKGETVKECVDAVLMAKKIGYLVSATFIFGLPTETHADRMDAVALAKELRLDQVRFNNATPYPGTELFSMARADDRLNVVGLYDNFFSVSTFIEPPFKPIPFSYVPEGASEQGIRIDLLFAYLAFYFNPRKIKEIIFKPNQGSGWFKAGEGLLGLFKKIPALIALFTLLTFKFSSLFFNIALGRHTSLRIRDFLRAIFGMYPKKKNRVLPRFLEASAPQSQHHEQ